MAITLGCFDCMERMRQQDATIRRLRRELREMRKLAWFADHMDLCGLEPCDCGYRDAWRRALAPKRPTKRRKA